MADLEVQRQAERQHDVEVSGDPPDPRDAPRTIAPSSPTSWRGAGPRDPCRRDACPTVQREVDGR